MLPAASLNQLNVLCVLCPVFCVYCVLCSLCTVSCVLCVLCMYCVLCVLCTTRIAFVLKREVLETTMEYVGLKVTIVSPEINLLILKPKFNSKF